MKTYTIKKYTGLIFSVLLFTCLFAVNSHAVLTDSTTLTVVHVGGNHWYGSIPTGEDVTTWQHWPPDDFMNMTSPVDDWELLITNVNIGYHLQSWEAYPLPYPWRSLHPTLPLNAMICNVWSQDGGRTYKLVSWDYMTSTQLSIHLESSWSSSIQWLGTIVHSFCGFEGETANVCNGRYRSNAYFTNVP